MVCLCSNRGLNQHQQQCGLCSGHRAFAAVRRGLGSACNWARARELLWILRLKRTVGVGAGISNWVGGSTWFVN